MLWGYPRPLLPDKIPCKLSLIVELETESARKTHSMILLCESQEPIKLHHVGLQSGCLQDEVADTQSSAFTHFHWLGNPKEN